MHVVPVLVLLRLLFCKYWILLKLVSFSYKEVIIRMTLNHKFNIIFDI